MMKAWEKNIRKVVPYVPGEQPNKERMIKLNTNENPYPPAPGVAEALKNLDPDRLRLYPDPACTRLVDAIAKQKGLKSEQIFVGVGSDDVLAMCFMTFFNSEKPILFPDITYSFYDVWAEEFRIPYETCLLYTSDGDYLTAGVWVIIILAIAFCIIVAMNLVAGKNMKNTQSW